MEREMASEFADKRVVVTGGTGGLGAAVCQTLIDLGAICHVPSRRAFAPEDFSLKDHERVHVATSVDLLDEQALASFYAELPDLWASIHVAGGFAMSGIDDTSLDSFQKMMKLNATSCFLSCREAVRTMRAGGGGGRIVNIASRPAVEPTASMTAYAASKAAVLSMTKTLAVELASEQILVNVVLPSIMDTPANRKAMPDADHDIWPKVSEVADAIAYLASPGNRLTSGAQVPVYGRA
jgi:NAD(P)-dependent dehydrogenase (short-subunit alcohol dehydrogenase family)